MIKPGISIKGKINKAIELDAKTNASIIREYPELEDLQITPTTSEQKFKSEKYGYNEVTVEAIESEELNVIPKNEKQHFEGMFNMVNVEEIKEEDVIAEVNFSDSDIVEIQPTMGSYLQRVTINKDENLKSSNVRKDVVINGIEGDFESIVEIIDLSYMFINGVRMNQMNEILSISKKATNATNMFSNSTSTSIDLSDWDSKDITDMNSMFYSCKKLIDVNLGGKFNTSNVTNMKHMFYYCELLKTLDLSNFDTSNVINMSYMFNYLGPYSAPITLDISHFNTSNVTSSSCMFDSLRAKEVDLGDVFDLSKVKSSSGSYMFNNCSLLVTIKANLIDLSNCGSFQRMFYGCKKLETIPAIKANTVTNVYEAFYNCSSLKNFGGLINYGEGIKSGGISMYNILDLTSCTQLTYESLMNIINNLAPTSNGMTLSLKLGETNLAKLIDEEIAIATDKRLGGRIKRKEDIYVS